MADLFGVPMRTRPGWVSERVWSLCLEGLAQLGTNLGARPEVAAEKMVQWADVAAPYTESQIRRAFTALNDQCERWPAKVHFHRHLEREARADMQRENAARRAAPSTLCAMCEATLDDLSGRLAVRHTQDCPLGGPKPERSWQSNRSR